MKGFKFEIEWFDDHTDAERERFLTFQTSYFHGSEDYFDKSRGVWLPGDPVMYDFDRDKILFEGVQADREVLQRILADQDLLDRVQQKTIDLYYDGDDGSERD